MSFPRAKLQRFNDTTSCAPPPGSYDPKFEDKVKGAVIEKSERFLEPKCPSVSSISSESTTNLSTTSNSTKSANMNCLPVFRTPQLPRKIVKQTSSAPQTKMRLKFEAPQKNEGSSKEVNIELYEAVLVDRDNKDATIHEYEVHIDELYERIREFEKELGQLQLQKSMLPETHKMGLQGTDNGICTKAELQSNELTDLKHHLEKRSSDLLEVQEKCTVLENTVSETRNLLASVEQEKQDLLVKVKQLKENEEELRCRYETDIKELDAVCKKLVDEMAGMKAKEDEKNSEVKEELSCLRNTNTDLESKLNQKQQMILMLQSELSSSELELEECKSEYEKTAAEFRVEKDTMAEKHGSDMENMRNLIERLERVLSEEREARMQEIQNLEENMLNSSVVRENLEAIIADKLSALSALNDKYLTQEAEFEKFCMEQKLVTEAHRLEMDEICNKHEEEMCKLSLKEKETEQKMEAMESEYEKTCMEYDLMTESYKLQVDEMKHKQEEELNDIREKLTDKKNEIEKRINEVMEACAELEEQVKEVKASAEENLKWVKNTAEERIKEFEVETAGRISDCESRMEVKLKEAEYEIHVYREQVTQVEEELRCMTHHRDELRISNMENQLTIVDLQDKIDMLVTELNSTKDSYDTKLVQAQNEYSMLKKQCKKLEIGIGNIQASLKALQMRLLESERYGEQLTNDVQQTKSQKAALEEQVILLTQELEANKQSMSQLERDTVQQIEDVRKDLLCKLEEFKVKADKNIAAKEEEILEHRHKTEELCARIFELTETLTAMEETSTEHEHEIEALTEKLDHQRDCAKIATQQIATLEASNAIYQHQVQALTTELEYQKDFSQKASDHIATLSTAKANMEKAVYDLISEVKAEREKALKYNGESEESSALMNYNSETVSDLMSLLRENLDKYKEEIKCVIQKLKSDINTQEFDIEQKNIDICRKKCEIKLATDRIAELMSENTKVQEKSGEYSNKLQELFSEIKEMKISFQEKLDSELKCKLADKEAYCQSLLDKVADLEKRYKETELLIGPFREQLEAFDEERQALELRKEAAEGEMRELGLRYAEILGHQNHKQKIKHMTKLREQIHELQKENERLESQLRTLKRANDKLKDEQRAASGRKPVLQQHNTPVTKGKENVDRSPVRKSPVSSPNLKALRKCR